MCSQKYVNIYSFYFSLLSHTFSLSFFFFFQFSFTPVYPLNWCGRLTFPKIKLRISQLEIECLTFKFVSFLRKEISVSVSNLWVFLISLIIGAISVIKKSWICKPLRRSQVQNANKRGSVYTKNDTNYYKWL